MNNQQKEILYLLNSKKYTNQREIAKNSYCSLGFVNSTLKNLKNEKYIDENMNLTNKAKKEFKENSPKNAIILAAGYGMRMVPINLEIPKGLLKVNNVPLIERLINQLNSVGITEIYIIVGFMKETYEYLIDKYNVKLIFNPDYPSKNNLHSLSKALNYLSNTYIIPCDIWCRKNPFSKNELYSWYLLSSKKFNDGLVKVNKKYEIISSTTSDDCNKMIGITYLTKEDSNKVKENIIKMSNDRKYNNSFWEDALFENGKMFISPKMDRTENCFEINTYEELRDLDSNSQDLDNIAIKIISETLNVNSEEITDISVLKKGMTNRSFLFNCKNQKYIMRIPRRRF